MSNDTSVFPVALLEYVATRPIADQADIVRGNSILIEETAAPGLSKMNQRQS
jgi:hypothetical protein